MKLTDVDLEVDENVGSLDNLKKLLIQKYYIEPEVRKYYFRVNIIIVRMTLKVKDQEFH